MFVKICGITNPDDACAAVAHGASAVGFVFWPSSPRFVEPDRAREIVATLPPGVSAVGVFVNQPAGEVNEIAAAVGLGVVQLHGDESEGYAALMGRPVIKAVAFSGEMPDVGAWPPSVTLLVDTRDPVRRGGTGRQADWAAAAAIARTRRVILAGGLTPDNVAKAIGVVQPYGIDVSSGVERSPGVKDHARIAALFAAVRTLGGQSQRINAASDGSERQP